MKRLLRQFCGDENGAITVDFIVLVAGISILALTISQTLEEPAEGAAQSMATAIEQASVR